MSAILLDLAPETLEIAQRAHQLMLKGDLPKGLQLYERLAGKDLLHIFYRSDSKNWILSNDYEAVALDDLCIYLIEYVISRTAWHIWQPIADTVMGHPQFAQIDAEKRARIEVINIFGQRFSRRTFTLEQQISTLKTILTYVPQATLGEALTRMTLGTTYRLLRRKDDALSQHYQVRDQLDLTTNPFYYIFNEELIGAVIYFLNQGKREYYLQAVEVYEEAERLALAHIGIDFAHQPYNLGWIYAELEELAQAEHEFTRGLHRAITESAAYELAQYQYGLGYVYLRQDRHDEARKMLIESLRYFADVSHIYSSACLNLLARLDGDNIPKALEWSHNALDHLKKIDDPVHLSHVYKTLSELYWRQGDWQHTSQYLAQHYWIKLRYNMPFFDQ
ncbi:MAG: hypothetical protein ACFE0Q_14825 [Anaerolineae bacterium]